VISRKRSAEDETAKGPAASFGVRMRPSSIRAGFWRSRMKTSRPSRAPPAAKLSPAALGEGDGGGGDDADSRHHDADTSIDDSSVNSLSADSHLGSSPFPGGSTLESVQSIVLGDSFSPAIIGSAHLLGTVGSPSNDGVRHDRAGRGKRRSRR